MSINYACQISCTLNGIKQKFLLDTIENVSVRTSSSLSSHPIAQGDYVGDHMYREQATVSISGSWSINGKSNLNLGEGRIKLISFESIFETIKNQGIICEILQISKNEASSNRFLKRTNMVLTSISWTEKINSLDFNFTFTQLITSNAATNALNYTDVSQNLGTFDQTDIYLPSARVELRNNFVTSYINYIAITSELIKNIFNATSYSKEILSRIKMLGKNGISSLGFSANDSSNLHKIVASYELNDCDNLLLNGFASQINLSDIALKYTKANNIIRSIDIENSCKYILNIYNKINNLSRNVSCYQLGSSGEQISTLLINNIYYEFQFKKNNTSGSYYLSVKNTNSESNEYSISSFKCASAPISFSNCLITNTLLKTNKTQVYLLKLNSNDYNDLTKYFVIVTEVSPSQFSSELYSIINEG